MKKSEGYNWGLEQIYAQQREADRRLKLIQAKPEAIKSLGRALSNDFSTADKIYEEKYKEILPADEYRKLKSKQCVHFLARILNSEGFLACDQNYEKYCKELLNKNQYNAFKIPFVKNWFKQNLPTNSSLPDDEQSAAISENLANLIVVARAGSGKTTTLVNRAFFLVKEYKIEPREILLLAFNKNAADEIKKRLTALIHGKREAPEATAGVTIPHVMTFHALAYAIVHPEEKIIYDDEEASTLGLSGAIQHLVNNCLQEDDYRDRIRLLMFDHFKNDWERIIKGKYDKSQGEFLEYIRSLPAESLGGDYVKSYGEKVIANFLFEHDINYKYERNHWWNGINYRPDFTLFFDTPHPSGVIIEYFGLKDDNDYDEMSKAKRAYWEEKEDWTLVEFTPRDIPNGNVDYFNHLLKKELEKKGFICGRLSEEEIWTRVRDRFVTSFSKAVSSFVGRCRQRLLSVDQLNALIARHQSIDAVESRFIELACDFYEKYLEHLKDTHAEDFNGLINRAIKIIQEGNTKFHRLSESGNLSLLKFISIDEYQDFSELFHKLIDAIRVQNSEVKLFCVGDDWQAINGFAGSNLSFFENFEHNYENSLRLNITTNYRSSQNIVECGNLLMKGFGIPAKSNKLDEGEILECDLEKFEPILFEKRRHPGDLMTPALLRVIHKGLSEGLDVVLLARRNGLPCYIHYPELAKGVGRGLNHFLDHIRRFFPEELAARIQISTSHRYKGLEKPMVVVLDALENCYPLIHTDWIFSRIHGYEIETITMEERRLFYVALTRAVSKLVIVYFGKSKTPFLDFGKSKDPFSDNFRHYSKLKAELEWNNYPPFQIGKATSVLVQIGTASGYLNEGTYPIKDRIKSAGYRWNKSEWPHWIKSFPLKNFNVDKLKSEAWALTANGVEVRIVDEIENIKEVYLIVNQRWEKL